RPRLGLGQRDLEEPVEIQEVLLAQGSRRSRSLSLPRRSVCSQRPSAPDPSSAGANETAPARPSAPRGGTKLAEVVELLQRDRGATIDELIDATGWLPHTTRAALTGLRKRGFA